MIGDSNLPTVTSHLWAVTEGKVIVRISTSHLWAVTKGGKLGRRLVSTLGLETLGVTKGGNLVSVNSVGLLTCYHNSHSRREGCLN